MKIVVLGANLGSQGPLLDRILGPGCSGTPHRAGLRPHNGQATAIFPTFGARTGSLGAKVGLQEGQHGTQNNQKSTKKSVAKSSHI